MTRHRTQEPLATELKRLLKERNISVRRLGELVGVDPTHISRVLNGKKATTGAFARQAARALELPEDYFPEHRAAVVISRIQEDDELRDRLYDDLVAAKPRPRAKRRD